MITFATLGNICNSINAYSADTTVIDDSQKLINELLTEESPEIENLLKQGSNKNPLEGFASYYANRMIGRRTTSGYRYDPKKFTAAHVSLPLGTVVKVVNRKNGKDVLVTVNDRCALKTYQFIDLSRAAAEKIGIMGKGKARVEIIPLQYKLLKTRG